MRRWLASLAWWGSCNGREGKVDGMRDEEFLLHVWNAGL